MPNPWHELTDLGQSVWYDNLNRQLILSGNLKRMVAEDRVSGGTSNPSIFEKAVGSSNVYDADIRRIVAEGKDVDAIYDELTITDVRESADVFRAAYDATSARDGYASLEVPPNLANDTEATVREARRLFAALDRPNTMIKIPGTQAGLPAIQQCLEDGININITLLFGVENYEQVANTYITALEKRAAAGKPVDRIGSVASFFVSRVDSLVDEKIERMIEIGTNGRKMKLASLRGQAAIANAKVAYDRYRHIFAGPRWQALADLGAQTQRCLWASTSTKNPIYRDVIYVEELIGSDTVNTVPPATLDAFRDHGDVAPTLDEDIGGARHTLMAIDEMGIDFKAVTDELQEQGVKLFCDSYDKARNTIRQKSESLAGARA
jgi:transaldolase